EIHVENSVHSGEDDENAAFDWNRSAAQARAGPSCGEGNVPMTTDSNDVGDLGRTARKNDGDWPRFVDRRVVFVQHKIVVRGQYAFRTDDRSKFLRKGGTIHGQLHRRGTAGAFSTDQKACYRPLRGESNAVHPV